MHLLICPFLNNHLPIKLPLKGREYFLYGQHSAFNLVFPIIGTQWAFMNDFSSNSKISVFHLFQLGLLYLAVHSHDYSKWSCSVKGLGSGCIFMFKVCSCSISLLHLLYRNNQCFAFVPHHFQEAFQSKLFVLFLFFFFFCSWQWRQYCINPNKVRKWRQWWRYWNWCTL